MKKVVLYTHDLEPITILDLSPFAVDYLARLGRVRLAVQMPPMLCSVAAMLPPIKDCGVKVVEIISEKFIRRGVQHIMLITYDEENALLLKCAFLPGQYSEINSIEAEAFHKGFLKAIQMIGAL